MAKYIKIFIFMLAVLVTVDTMKACNFTINKNVIQPTCGSNGIISFSITPSPSNSAIYEVYKNSESLVRINGAIANLNSLAPGTYKVIVTDLATGCTDSLLGIVLDPAANSLNATCFIDSARCDTSKNGKITLKVVNYTSPLTYVWSHNPAEKDSIADTLNVGSYNVTITDATNCRFEISNMVVKELKGIMLAIDTIITPTSCDSPNGVIDLVVTGRHMPIFVWRQVNTTIANFDSLSMPLDSLPAGKYTCYFTDTLKCHPLEIKELEVKKNPPPKAMVIGTDSICLNEQFGYLQVVILAGDSTHMKYYWNDPASSTTKRVEGLSSGTYMVTVMDKAGCIDTPKKTIYDYPPRVVNLIADKDQIVKNIEVFIKIDTLKDLYDIVWTPTNKLRQTNNNAWVFPDTTTTYTMTAKYGPGCITKATKTIVVIPVVNTMIIPDMFSPNNDGRNDVYVLRGENNEIETFEIEIYDRWGNVVYNARDVNFQWFGTDMKGNAVMSGVYTYLIKYTLASAPFDRIVKSGTILLEK